VLYSKYIYVNGIVFVFTVVQHITVINQLTPEQMLPREKFHVDAFKAYTSGDLPGACVCWEASIVEYPRGQYV